MRALLRLRRQVSESLAFLAMGCQVLSVRAETHPNVKQTIAPLGVMSRFSMIAAPCPTDRENEPENKVRHKMQECPNIKGTF